VFARLFLINRSDQDYDSVFFGQYNHFALGNNTDNFVTTQVGLNAVYGFNGDNDDEGKFGSNLPYAACVFLNTDLSSSKAFHPTDSIRMFPENLTEIWNVVKGNWRTGDAVTYAGKGYETSSNEGKFIYPQNTDPQHSNANWQDKDAPDGVGERNALGVAGPFKLNNNGVIKIDLAFISGLMADSISHNEIATEITKVRKQYEQTLNIADQSEKGSKPRLFPNPIVRGHSAVFQCLAPTTMKLYDQTGRLIADQSYTAGSHTLEVPLIPGIYLLEYVTGNNKSHSRLVIQ
jgi:hypothetical protein